MKAKTNLIVATGRHSGKLTTLYIKPGDSTSVEEMFKSILPMMTDKLLPYQYYALGRRLDRAEKGSAFVVTANNHVDIYRPQVITEFFILPGDNPVFAGEKATLDNMAAMTKDEEEVILDRLVMHSFDLYRDAVNGHKSSLRQKSARKTFMAELWEHHQRTLNDIYLNRMLNIANDMIEMAKNAHPEIPMVISANHIQLWNIFYQQMGEAMAKGSENGHKSSDYKTASAYLNTVNWTRSHEAWIKNVTPIIGTGLAEIKPGFKPFVNPATFDAMFNGFQGFAQSDFKGFGSFKKINEK